MTVECLNKSVICKRVFHRPKCDRDYLPKSHVNRHSSVDSSAPTILPPQVRVPSTRSMILSLTVKFVLYLSREKNENKQKEAGLGPFFKKVPEKKGPSLVFSIKATVNRQGPGSSRYYQKQPSYLKITS